MSNLRSVERALHAVGADAAIIDDPDAVRSADAAILPGQGEFSHCMKSLETSGMDEAIREFWKTGKPFLGICIGLQVLYEGSEEAPGIPGLGLLKGKVKRFQPEPGIKIPHMGWNALEIKQSIPLLEGLPERPYAYFVHSFYAEPDDPGCLVTATVHGNTSFASTVWKENVIATQFHPEKSQRVGLHILQNFIRWKP
jgi:glutamine amidotransferase